MNFVMLLYCTGEDFIWSPIRTSANDPRDGNLGGEGLPHHPSPVHQPDSINTTQQYTASPAPLRRLDFGVGQPQSKQ